MGALRGAQRTAWRAVPSEARGRIGMSREFPTANEIAEGEFACRVWGVRGRGRLTGISVMAGVCTV